MAHHIPEHKIIIVQTVIFIGLLVLLSFILEGCTSRQAAADICVESGYQAATLEMFDSRADDCNEARAISLEDCTGFLSPELLIATRSENKNIIPENLF